MLVLSRKAGEAICFPALDITITVSQLRGRCVSLGVEAPDDIQILRKELVPKLTRRMAKKSGGDLDHRTRNRLNSIGLSLNILLRQLEKGIEPDLGFFKKAISDLNGLDQSLEDSTPVVEEPVDKLAMIVEDNENEGSLLAAFLKGFGYQVVTALDGRAALNFLDYAPVRPDIILLDMNMPRMNGADTVRVIRNREDLQGMKLFAVSGATEREMDISIGEGGVDRWFQKPIEPMELVAQIDRELAA